MPALDNPRWERFAQAIVEGLANGDRKPYSQGRAYIAAGYTAKDQGKRGGSAECAASRLLNRVKPILERVREIQAEAAAKAEVNLDRIRRRLDLASRMAEQQENPSALITAELGIAKVFGLEAPKRVEQGKPGDFSQATTPEAIADKLLTDIGLNPAHVTPQARSQAVAAYDAFMGELERIRDSQRLAATAPQGQG
jgi:phage terminase small subunit